MRSNQLDQFVIIRRPSTAVPRCSPEGIFVSAASKRTDDRRQQRAFREACEADRELERLGLKPRGGRPLP